MEHVAQFPRHDSVVHRRQTQGDGPEGLGALLLKGADDGGTDMFLFDRGLATIYGFVNSRGLQVRVVLMNIFVIFANTVRNMKSQW